MEIRNPPGRCEDSEQRDDAKKGAPDSQRSDSRDAAIFFGDTQTKSDVGGQRHQPDEWAAEKSDAD